MTSSNDFLEAGLTYRELDYWTTLGLLVATELNPGSGRFREWAPIELDIARMIRRLREADITLAVAARVARDYVMTQLVDGLASETGDAPEVGPIEIAPGISIIISEVRDE